MELETVAKILKELGHPVRLTVYKEISKAGYTGIPVGDIQARVNIPASTLTHHISALVSAKLVKQRREGRVLFCSLECGALESVIDYLTSECCIDELSTKQ
ncbi:ArsR/SmtB family transcription factor [Alteromonas sp. S015]|uniref:ArsR/SmtB family transcription factor n=1 Tax=Alteromonas sp. S015 TaxID=3117401 RepID=UPI002FE1D977